MPLLVTQVSVGNRTHATFLSPASLPHFLASGYCPSFPSRKPLLHAAWFWGAALVDFASIKVSGILPGTLPGDLKRERCFSGLRDAREMTLLLFVGGRVLLSHEREPEDEINTQAGREEGGREGGQAALLSFQQLQPQMTLFV